MTAQKIQAALGLLQDDPENESAWSDVAEAVTAPAPVLPRGELQALLEAARGQYEALRQWDAVARILELEAGLHAGSPVEIAMQFELARVLDDECFETEGAETAYRRLLQLRPDEPSALEALERLAHGRAHWEELVARYVNEASEATESTRRSSRLSSAAELLHRFADATPERVEQTIRCLEQAIEASAKNERAAALLERIYSRRKDWEQAARVAEITATASANKESRVAALVRIARLAEHRLGSEGRASAAYERVLDLSPGHGEAMTYLSSYFSKHEQWDHLVALYEDQLRGGGARPGEEAAIVFQIAMVHWRMRGDARAAEPWFDRLRRQKPSHPGMLDFFRQHCATDEGRFRLITVLSDAQRAMSDGPEKAKLAAEIAKLAEEGANAQKAIDQYKTILRAEPENEEARAALKRLYVQTEGWNALIELLRQQLERVPSDDVAERAAVLREIAAVYRDHIKSDTALVTVLSQLVALDETDLESLRELLRAYEALGRFRDLLQYQGKLAKALPVGPEKTDLLLRVARRWFEQFSNVQNATEAYEALLAVEPAHEEAISRLRELYLKRRGFAQLYSLYERELPSKQGQERWELLAEMAKLAAERLDRGGDAVRLYKQILSEQPERLDVLDSLERQAEREKDYASVAEVLERRLELAADDTARIALLQKVGTLHAEKRGDHEAAARAFRRVLELQPGHGKALRVLRDSYLASGDFDGLSELYASQNDGEGLAEVLSNAADRAEDPELKVLLSFRAARVFVDVLGAPERAFRSYERVLSVRPNDLRAAEALVPLYENDERWARLPALYEVLLAHADDARKPALYEKLVEVTGKRLNDAQTALAWALRAHESAPTSATLEMLEATSRAARSWDAYIAQVEGMLVKKGKKKPKAAERRELQKKLAKLHAGELGQLDQAIASYRALVEEHPDDVEAIGELDRLLRATDRRDDLRWLYDLRAERASAEEKAALFSDWASLEEDVFGEPARAISLYRRALEAVPGHEAALRPLQRLLLAAGDAAGAAEVLERHRDLVPGAAGASHELALAELYLGPLARPSDALSCAVRALELSPGEPRALEILDTLLGLPETRARAAEALERQYEALGDPARQARALSAQLEATTDPAARLDLFVRLSELQETKLRNVDQAFELVLAALAESPEDLPLWDKAAELSSAADRPNDLALAYRAAAFSEKLPETIEIELCERAARLHDDRLGDPQAATPYLERILSRQPADERAFARLKQIFTSYERWSELEAMYAQAIGATTDPSRRIELLHEIALVCEEITSEPEKAVAHHERILEIEPLHETAIRALDRLYEGLGRFTQLAASLERRLGLATLDETVSLKLRLGKLLLERLGDPAGALSHLEGVLELDAANLEARTLLEKLLDHAELRSRVAEALEAAYEAADDARALAGILEIRLEGADEAARRERLRRIAELCEERLDDERGAFDAYARLVPLDANDTVLRQRFVDLGRRLGAHARLAEVLERAADGLGSSEAAAEILMEGARINEEFLGDTSRAEAMFRRALQSAEADPRLALDVARELSRLYTAAGEHAALAEMLKLESEFEDDPQTRRLLLFRLAELFETALDDRKRAIATLRTRLDDEPTDDEALAGLERLYTDEGSLAELASVLHARAELSLDPEARKSLMVQRARLLTEKLENAEAGLSAWQAVLDDFGPEPETLQALARLHERAERFHDLVATLETELSISDEPETRVALLARIGELRHRQSDGPGALDALREALTLDPSHEPSRNAVRALLDSPEVRHDAALLLHPLYEADADHQRLLEVIEIELEYEEDPTAKLSLFDRALRIAESPLNDWRLALGLALHALPLAANEPDFAVWLQRAEDLADKTNLWADLAPVLGEVLSELQDDDARLEVTLKLAAIAEGRLGDHELARDNYVKALDVRADEPRALARLQALYEQTKNVPALLDVLKRRIESTFEDTERKQLLARKAHLLETEANDREGAISAYEAILDVGFDREAASELARLYTATQRFGDLMDLYERELSSPSANRADLHVRMARLAHEHLVDTDRAFDCLQAALGIEPRHEASVTVLEELLEGAPQPEQRARAAEMLEPIYLQLRDHRRVIATLEARLASAEDPFERRPLLERLARIQEEQVEDFAAALETTARLFHDDPSDETTREQLERLAKVSGNESRLAEIFDARLSATSDDDEVSAALARRTGALYASLGNVQRALHFYRRALAFEPESQPVFEAIDALLQREGRHTERAELYRDALEHRYEPADRVALLHALAELERTKLGDLDKAIATYRAILEIDERDAKALDTLTSLFRERQQFVDLAELYQLRAEHAPTEAAASELLLLLARLHREDLADLATALDCYEQVALKNPSHRGAVADLEALARGSELAERAAEILRPLYERADDWRRIIALDGQRFELAESPADKVAILREVAQLWEERGRDPERALGALKQAFELDPEDGAVRAELERVALSLEAWDELASTYESVLPNAEALTQQELLATLAKLHDDRRGDFRAALGCHLRLASLDELDPAPLDAADELALLLGDWRALTDVLTKKIKLLFDDVERAALHRRVAEIRRDMLGDDEGAIAAYEQALELAPEDVVLLDRLLALYEPKNDAARLVELYSRRADLAGPDEADLQYELLLRAATRFERDLGDPREAIAKLHRALELRPGEASVLVSLARLLEAEQLYPDLLENLKLQASLAATSAERARFRKEIAKLHSTQLDDPAEAVETLRLVLDETPADAEAARFALDIADAHEELRLVVAEMLEPVLRTTSQWELLTRSLTLRLGAESEPLDRARTLQAIATVLEESLKRPGEALETLLGALAETPDDPALHEDLARLAAASSGWARYADALDERAGQAFDATLAKSLLSRLGAVAADHLDDPDRAISAFTRALDRGGDDAEILVRLDALYARAGKHAELAQILERRIDLETEAVVQADLLNRLGRLQLETSGDEASEAQGLVTLRRALERVPDHAGAREALEALAETPEKFEQVAEILEEVYRQQGDHDRLTVLFEKRISFVADALERRRMRLELAQLLEDRLGDTKRAQAVLEEALVDARIDAGIVAEIERLATIHDGWESAARKLEAALSEAKDLDSTELRALFLKLAAWYEEKLGNGTSAEAAYEKALALDEGSLEILQAIERVQRADGRHQELVGTLRRIAELESDPPLRRELLREAKSLADKVEDPALAEEVLRQLLRDDDADLWALEELTKLRNRTGDAKDVVSLLLRRAELVDDSASITLRHEAAEIARARLDDVDQAIALLEGILDSDATDARAARSLRKLYAEANRNAELCGLIARLVRVAATTSERSQLRIELAKLQAEKLDAASDAIETLRAVLEEESGHPGAVVSLSNLYETTHRDEDLAELLRSQIALAKSRGDIGTELALTIRLAEMYAEKLHDKPKAISAYRSALVCDASHEKALEALAKLLEETGELAEAGHVLEARFRLAKGDKRTAIAIELADLHARLGDDEGSRRTLEQGLEGEPRHPELRRKLAEVYERTKAFGPLAELLAQDADAETDPTERVALYRRAAELHSNKLRDSAAAASLLEKASELAPEDRELLLLLCDAYSASGRGKDAAAALEKIVVSFAGRRTKELATVHLRLSRAYLADGDKSRALVELDQAFRIDPGSVPILRELGALALEAGDLERAQRTFRALLLQKLDPGGPITKGEVFYYLGEISHRLGDKTKAVQMLERALENEANLEKARTLLAELKK